MIEYDSEPVRGLPEALPAGEHILWQGAPDWKTLARTGLHTHAVALYFGVLVGGGVLAGMIDGRPLGPTLSQASLLAVAGLVAVGLLALYAFLSARTTVYTLTNRRFVLRHGVALNKCFNLPYAIIGSAGLKADARGFGDIPLSLSGENKIAYPLLWPHVRPFRFSKPEPMLRAVPEAASVAAMLGQALQAVAREANRPYSVGTAQGDAQATKPSAPALA